MLAECLTPESQLAQGKEPKRQARLVTQVHVHV